MIDGGAIAGGHQQTERKGDLIDPARFLRDLANPGLVSAIDLMRWLAAAVVVVSHVRFPLVKGYALLLPEQRPLWVQAWYFLTGYYVEAVLIFFVLSGFLVGGMGLARLKQGTFDPPGYAVDRFSRLYTAFLPALLLSVALTWVGMRWFDATGLYSGTHPTFAASGTTLVFADNAGWGNFTGNLFMLQWFRENLFAAPYGANPPLYTLSSEFWFYAIFGLIGAAANARAGKRVVLIAIAVAATLVLGSIFWLYLGMWLIGVAAAVIRPTRLPIAIPALGLFGGILILRRYIDAVGITDALLRNAVLYGVCISMGLVLLGLRGRRLPWAEAMAPFNKAMADFSYSLYLIHYPLMILFVAMLGTLTGAPGFAEGMAPTEPLALVTYGAAIALSFGAAWIFAQVFERRTGLVRGWLKRHLLRR